MTTGAAGAPARAGETAPEMAPARAAAWRTVATFSRGVARIPNLAALLGAERVSSSPSDSGADGIDAVIGWGEKANTEIARRYAARHRIPYWRAEDGFLRSVGLGAAGDPPLSIVLDDCGIYYDAREPSRLERILQGGEGDDPLEDAALVARARRAIDRIVGARLSKYNHTPPGSVELDGARPRVLVVDQTRGDLSVSCGLADASSFDEMLARALDEHPDADIVVKTHPDVIAGKKRGYLESVRTDARTRVVGDAVNPIALLEQVDHVYVVTSQLGFEALMLGKAVSCFGAPFYAGWGLTDDRIELPRRSRVRTLEQLFAAAYILYPRYLDPSSGRAGELEQVIDYLALQREQFERNRGTIFCVGFQFWKHNYVRAYLRSPGNRIVFARTARRAERLGFDGSARLLAWGQRGKREVEELGREHGVPVWRMEDGFLRSVGLGSDLAEPSSLVVDRQGIYYDPTCPSELETILETGGFTSDELARAAALHRKIVESGLSKYNVGSECALEVPADRTVVLVPGQVEDDASIQLGCRDVRTNLGLLQEVRRARPDAYVIYKPHPDVLSGNRRGGVDLDEALAVCDHIEQEASLAACLAVAHEVHTLTSLVGFEALLRGLRVVVYGQPFYAGWGLTVDRHSLTRRTRALSLDELVAGALIRYPRYLDYSTGRFTTPEAVVEQLVTGRDASASQRRVKLSWPRRQLRKLRHIYRGVFDAS